MKQARLLLSYFFCGEFLPHNITMTMDLRSAISPTNGIELGNTSKNSTRKRKWLLLWRCKEGWNWGRCIHIPLYSLRIIRGRLILFDIQPLRFINRIKMITCLRVKEPIKRQSISQGLIKSFPRTLTSRNIKSAVVKVLFYSVSAAIICQKYSVIIYQCFLRTYLSE